MGLDPRSLGPGFGQSRAEWMSNFRERRTPTHSQRRAIHRKAPTVWISRSKRTVEKHFAIVFRTSLAMLGQEQEHCQSKLSRKHDRAEAMGARKMNTFTNRQAGADARGSASADTISPAHLHTGLTSTMVSRTPVARRHISPVRALCHGALAANSRKWLPAPSCERLFSKASQEILLPFRQVAVN